MRIFLFVFLLAAANPILAGVRHFTFIYEAPTSSPGSVDVENSMTWAHGGGGGTADALVMRHELEFGLTARLQGSLYLADWEYTREKAGHEIDYTASALEFIFNFSNPVIDPIGLSAYQEVRGGPHLVEWESKLIAQKNLGPIILAWNGTIEATWEGERLDETEGEIQQAIGASYELSPRLSLGAEILQEFVFPQWRGDKDMHTNVFAGPNICYRQRNWFATVTALAQATDTADESALQLRTIFGVAF